MVYRYLILGQPIVKKNTQRSAWINGKPVRYNTANYKAWERYATIQLRRQPYPPEPISTPILLVCKFFMQSKRVVDLSALYEGIQDLLVKEGILLDDHARILVGHDGSRVFYDKNNPRIEVEIVPESA